MTLNSPLQPHVTGIRHLRHTTRILIAATACAMLAAGSTSHAQTPQGTSESPQYRQLVKAAQAEGTVVVYHTAVQATMAPLFEAFQKRYGIKVQIVFATGASLGVRFETEAESGRIQADVVSFSDASYYVRHPEWFQKLSADNLPNYSLLPATGKLPTATAVGPILQSFSLMYNTKKVAAADVPRTWNDLGNPKWKGQLLLADPRATATQRIAFVEISKRNPGLLSRIRDNQPRIVESATPTAQYLSAGTGSIGFLAYAAHAAPLIRKGAPLQWATVEGPEVARNNWVGAANGPHPNAGRLFTNFFLSDEAISAYCRAPGVKSSLDPDGKRTGCAQLSSNVVFLPETPPAKSDVEAIVRDLGLQ